MPAEGFTRINCFAENPLTGIPCFQRFNVPTQALTRAYERNLRDSPDLSAFSATVFSTVPDLTQAQLPPSAPLNATIKHHRGIAPMLGQLEEEGVLVPMETSLPLSGGARNPGSKPQPVQS
ncbi:MAG: hypothetical protein KBA75_06770 [Alphaproteobacteria bacterium]|nr:hypothetical protein [Alphaproteobacteria bacterium]